MTSGRMGRKNRVGIRLTAGLGAASAALLLMALLVPGAGWAWFVLAMIAGPLIGCVMLSLPQSEEETTLERAAAEHEATLVP